MMNEVVPETLVQRLQDGLVRFLAGLIESLGYDVQISKRVDQGIEPDTVLLLTIAIAVIAAIVMVLIIHQIRKPRFARLEIAVTEEPSMYESSYVELPNSKKPMNALRCGVNGENCDVSNAQLQSVILKPARSAKAIDVVCKKIEADYEVTMGGKALKAGKKVRWHLDGELKIRRMNEESALVMKLCEKQRDDGVEDFEGWLEEDRNDAWGLN